MVLEHELPLLQESPVSGCHEVRLPKSSSRCNDSGSSDKAYGQTNGHDTADAGLKD